MRKSRSKHWACRGGGSGANKREQERKKTSRQMLFTETDKDGRWITFFIYWFNSPSNWTWATNLHCIVGKLHLERMQLSFHLQENDFICQLTRTSDVISVLPVNNSSGQHHCEPVNVSCQVEPNPMEKYVWQITVSAFWNPYLSA